ncbi:CYTH domain-containing protein [Modicisalibacter tunisiensis]|uniref:CYTH domain-containing protein n=1 Tax=Modicisalibacter tunisiensis TaxID=390637 RepID=A0ABS7WUV0_9GAMM|nr:CYTH domain-containing protein [Modicisalibacter tunisiensis]MBZ9566388.1 CYTH domain-containing protein [Modicisalibacter tunisiensis]
MPQEIELKLALGAGAAEALPAHPRLAGIAPVREHLANTYYDTPAGDLERARVALRIRRTPDRWLQTLKTAGQGSGGLSTRGEWEWEIPGPALDLEGLAALEPMQALGEPVLASLSPGFTTDFERLSWWLEGPEATIEVALDNGEVRAGERRAPIEELELELELKGGDPAAGAPAALWRLAEDIADTLALRPANTSKAARGAALRDGRWPLEDAPLPSEAAARFDRAITALDALADSGDARFLGMARAALQSLADDTTLPADPRDSARELASALDATPWLTPAFGRRSLALLAALHRR